MFPKKSFCIAAISAALCATAGCLHVGEPTPDERRQLQTWSAAVSDEDRAAVQREANAHTEWMERKRTQWMITEYQSRYAKTRAKAARRAAATQRAATMRAATMPATQP